jgi:hypothetical protein
LSWIPEVGESSSREHQDFQDLFGRLYISRVCMMVAGYTYIYIHIYIYIYKESGGSIGRDYEDPEITLVLGFSRAGVQ